MTSAQVTVAIVLGGGLAVASSAHCAVMCGPLALAARVRHGARASLSYFTGRLVSYGVLGALAGGAGRVILLSAWARWAEVGLSWLLALALGITGVRLVRGAGRGAPIRLGRAPRVSLVGRLLARVADDPLLLGLVTALLPCGALFSALIAAAGLGSAPQGALAMVAFAVLSGGAVLAVGQLGRLDVRAPAARRAVAGGLLIGAVIMVARPLPSLLSADAPACHGAAASVVQRDETSDATGGAAAASSRPLRP